jgi:hypothetical protein
VTLQAFGSNPQTVERTIPVTNTSNREVVVNASIDSVARFSLVGSGAFLIPAKSTIQIPIRCDPGSFDGDFSTTLRLFEGNQQVASVLLEAQIRRFSAFPSGGSKYGLLFAPNNGGPAPPQKYGIANPTTSPVNFGVQVANSPAGGAFQVTPLEGTIPAAGTFELTVTPPSNASASARALISVYNTADPNAEPLWITAVGADYPGANQLSQRAQGACSPSELLAVFTAPGLAPPVQTGQTVGLGVQIADDCGNSLETGQVSVEFDNGDAAVELYAAGDGQWNGAWRPRNAEHGSVTLKALAFSADGSLFGFETLTLEIAAGTDPPPLFESRSITNAASQLPNLPLAGAEIISIYGQALASSEAGASTLPLPVTLGGASVSLEGEPLPCCMPGRRRSTPSFLTACPKASRFRSLCGEATPFRFRRRSC